MTYIQDILWKIFDNNIMYSIIVPLSLVILEWIKNKHDINEKNKELGYWKMQYRQLHTFPHIAMKAYKAFAINFVVIQVVKIFLLICIGEVFSYILSGTLYLVMDAVWAFLICRNTKAKVEFLTDRKCKVILMISLYIIYIIPFFLELYGKFTLIMDLIFGVALFTWIYCLYKYCDIAFILDNRYADIYVKGSEKAQFAEVGSIRERGEWIIVNREENGCEEEIRIREDDIVRIDYYGGPTISVEKREFFRKR